MNNTTKTSTRLAALAGLALTASANAAVIVNPSFEVDDVADGGFTNGLATGWDTVGTSTGTQDFTAGQVPQPTDGEQHGVVSFQSTSLSQVTSHTISSGLTYTLTVDVGQVSNFSGSEATIFLFGGTTGIATPLSNTNGTAEQAGVAPGSGAYLLNQTVTYTALASSDPFEGEQIGIGFYNSVGTQTLFDNVRLDIVAVPEPSSAALLGLGGFALILRRRK